MSGLPGAENQSKNVVAKLRAAPCRWRLTSPDKVLPGKARQSPGRLGVRTGLNTGPVHAGLCGARKCSEVRMHMASVHLGPPGHVRPENGPGQD